MAEKEKKYKDLHEFLQETANLEPEELEVEMKKLSSVERENVKATEYIAAEYYPPKHVDMKKFKLTLKVAGKLFYPIVGWNPDALSPSAKSSIAPMRKWLNSLKKMHLHNSNENRSYILYY